MLAALVEREWLARSRSSSSSARRRSPQPTWPDGLELSGEKRYGETAMWFAEPPPREVVA